MEEENQKAVDNAMFKKLEELSIKMPSDPILYKTDVDKYHDYFKVEFQKVQGDTMKKNQRFGELLIFLARSVKYFPEKLGWVPGAVMRLMEELGPSLHSYLRKKCAGSIMILRAKNILLPVSTIEFLLKQMRLQDKELRSMVYKYVLNDIRRMNKHHQNNKINQQIKAFVSAYIPKHTDKTAQKSLKLLIELYKRNVWTDNRTVNIIAQACFAPSSRSRLMACHFLMQTTMSLDELPESEDDLPNPSDIKEKKGITHKTRHKEKQLEKEKRKAARRLRKKQIESRNVNFMPIDLIYNPQVFVEKLFNIMSGRQQKYAHKLVYMSLIARIIWRHQLILLPFYRSLIKFLDPKQKDVANVLTALAESIHDVVPEDQIETIVKHIIEHFVNDRCSEFTMTIGLNTVREIFKKLPSIITDQMMLYLCTYYEYKNKNVSRAAKSVINFVREYNPSLLEKKFRGNKERNGEEEEEQVGTGRIPGVELLNEDGAFPVEMDRILTDQDFKKMRRLVKKKEDEEQWGKKIDNQIQSSDQEQEEDEEQEDEQEGQGQQGDDEQLQFDSDECEELDDDQEEGEDDGQIDEEGEQEEGSEESSQVVFGDDESVLQFESDQEEKTNKHPSKTKQIKKTDKTDNKKDNKADKKKDKSSKENKQSDVSSEQDNQQDYESEQNDNPHGFIPPNQIAFYKYSKTELKKDRTNIKQAKQKFKHTPKEKKGGSNNREKQKFKPLMMLRGKKNKIRSGQKQLKLKIKNLKCQLGKVRSGKQAKKMKNKKIVKTKKR